MLKNDYRIIKQIRDQFSTSKYLADSINFIGNLSKEYLDTDTFVNDLPLNYYIETTLIKTNAETFRVYQEAMKTILRSLKEKVKPENKEEFEDKIRNHQNSSSKHRREMMNTSFNTARDVNIQFCEEIMSYFQLILPKNLLETKVGEIYSLKSDSMKLPDNSNLFPVVTVSKSTQLTRQETTSKEINTDFPYEEYSDDFKMHVSDIKFHDSPPRSIAYIDDEFLIFSNDGREPLKYLYFDGPNANKVEKAKTVNYDFASYSRKNNTYIGYKNGNITLCQNNQKIEGWSKAKSIWFKTFKSDHNNNFYFPFDKNCIRIVLDLDFKKSNDSVFVDVKDIPGTDIRDFSPFGDLRMLIVSYNGIISVTYSNEIVSQMNLHLTRDEVTKALCLSDDEQYFCVSIKNTKPKVPSLRFFKLIDKGKSFQKLCVIDFGSENLIKNDYSYFFAINFKCTLSGRPVLTAFQCFNEFRVYSVYIDKNDKVQKIGWRKTENKKFVWDCKCYKGTVFSIDRELNMTRVTYESLSEGLEKKAENVGEVEEGKWNPWKKEQEYFNYGEVIMNGKKNEIGRMVEGIGENSFEEDEKEMMKDINILELNLGTMMRRRDEDRDISQEDEEEDPSSRT